MVKDSKLFPFVRWVRPELNGMEGNNLVGGFIETALTLWVTPFAVIGFVWLAAVTDFGIIRDNLLPFLFIQIALFTTERQTFRIYVELEGGLDAGPISSLAILISWSTILILGPVALWLSLVSTLIGNIHFALRMRRAGIKPFWSSFSLFIQDTASILSALVALWVFTAVGGTLPVEGLSADIWLPLLAAILTLSIVPMVYFLPPALFFGRIMGGSSIPAGFWLGIIVFTLLPTPFALLGANLYAHAGWTAFFFFVVGVVLVNYMAHHLSKAQRRSQQQSRALAHLEALGEALLEAPADASTLPDVLARYLPAIFPLHRLEIRLFEEAGNFNLPVFHQVYPSHLSPVSAEIWDRIQKMDEPYFIEQNKETANPNLVYRGVVGSKIVLSSEAEGSEICLGGIFLSCHEIQGPISPSLSTIQTLASQIGTALFRAEVHAETLSHQKVTQELEFAGRIQASFLPKRVPELTGWQIAATIEPARQTSGDFYDFIPLGDGKLGMIVADVADKGTGAALYMALSRTLIRTYAMENGVRPDLALTQANERILADTESDQFVTVFYGILDQASGLLTYANAGHNPGYLIHGSGNGHSAGHTSALIRTGIPLGMFPNMAWKKGEVVINPGDLLFLYSDGVTEAQNQAGELFEDERLLAVGRTRNGRSAEEIQTAVLEAIHTFVGDTPQFDDITLLVVTREQQLGMVNGD